MLPQLPSGQTVNLRHLSRTVPQKEPRNLEILVPRIALTLICLLRATPQKMAGLSTTAKTSFSSPNQALIYDKFERSDVESAKDIFGSLSGLFFIPDEGN